MSQFDPVSALSWALSLGLHTLVCVGLSLSGWTPAPRITPPSIEIEVGAQAVSALVLPSEPTGEQPDTPEQLDAPPNPLEEPLKDIKLAQIEPKIEPPQPPELLPKPEPLLTTAVEPSPSPTPAQLVKNEPRQKEPTRRPTPPRSEKTAPNTATRAAHPGSLGSYGAEGSPGLIRNPAPPYPEAERQAGHEGVVRLRVLVEADGHPSRVELAASSGYPALDASALTTVRRQWRFQPARQAGLPVAREIVLPVRFVLRARTGIGM